MEHLSVQDQPPPQPSNGSSNQPGPLSAPQLPPQMFTTAAQLLDLTDKKLLLILRDGRKIFGVLRSWDQFANLVLTSTVERYFASPPSAQSQTLFADIERGTYLVRGENVLMLGEVDLDKDDELPAGCVKGDIQEVFALKKEEERKRGLDDKIKGRRFNDLWGGEMENSGEVLF